jgi:cell fate (sporulation/competence/biofilm development) regulator YlbF (YheA/YmcA/DUF963 family)
MRHNGGGATLNPYDTAHELAQTIQSTDQYKELMKVRSSIEKDSATLHMLQDYRTRQWDLQAKQLQGQTLSSDEREAFEKLTEVVSMNQDVKKYLELETYFNNVLMDIYGILSKTVSNAALPHPWINDVSED